VAVNIIPLEENQPRFAGFPPCGDLDSLDADVAVIGIPYRAPHEISIPEDQEAVPETGTEADAPTVLRRHSLRYEHSMYNYDFEFGGQLLAGRDIRVVDCGDLIQVPGAHQSNLETITTAIWHILERGAVPIIFGGDHGTPIPVLRVYKDRGPFCVVQIDAHLDFIDERNGIKESYSSVGRRAAEMSWVSGLYQIGLRGVGSARQEEFDAARSLGSVMVRAEEVHRQGIDTVLTRLPEAQQYYITICADGLDPSIAPGVHYPEPGGLSYFELVDLFRGIGRRGKIIGYDFTSWVPGLDVRNLTAIFASRLALVVIGVMAHEGQIGRSGRAPIY